MVSDEQKLRAIAVMVLKDVSFKYSNFGVTIHKIGIDDTKISLFAIANGKFVQVQAVYNVPSLKNYTPQMVADEAAGIIADLIDKSKPTIVEAATPHPPIQ